MRTSLACVFGLALLVGISHGAPEASAAGLAKRIQDANPASAELQSIIINSYSSIVWSSDNWDDNVP